MQSSLSRGATLFTQGVGVCACREAQQILSNNAFAKCSAQERVTRHPDGEANQRTACRSRRATRDTVRDALAVQDGDRVAQQPPI